MIQNVLSAVLLAGLVAAQPTAGRASRTKQTAAPEPIEVSLIELIATPERFDRRLIRVIGFLRLEFEGNALYLHETDFCHGISKNAVWVDVGWPPDDKHMTFNNGYVLLEGVFNARSKGHMRMFAGSVQRVSRLDGWSGDTEPRRCDPRLYEQPKERPDPIAQGGGIEYGR